jgi:pyruvate dehydrogenase E2 component (dihydrolipoamide acetyltransferase)
VKAAAPAAAPAPAAAKNEKVLATPVTRRIAREHGLDLSEVAGSGPQGRVLKKDVLAVVEGTRAAPATVQAPSIAPAPVAAPTFAPAAADERMPIRGLRKAIFKKMVQSEQFAVPFTYVDEVDMTELVGLRDRVNAKLAGEGLKLTFLPFIAKALVAALRKFPTLNALMDEEKQELVVRKQYNLGIGVATDAGLTVAVLHDADRRSLKGIGQELVRLGDAARAGKLTQGELTGSTFTITSLGKDGGMFATPVINHPEVAILGIHRIEARPVVIDRQIVVRDRMYMSCSFDHRVIDGHVGAAFVAEVKRYLESPELLLLEMT